jgi:hypothetical protein
VDAVKAAAKADPRSLLRPTTDFVVGGSPAVGV